MDKKYLRRWAYTHIAIILEGALAEDWPQPNLDITEYEAKEISNIVKGFCESFRKRGLAQDDIDSRNMRVLYLNRAICALSGKPNGN